MKTHPLACPKCARNDWTVLRAVDTGAFALDCNSCRARVALGEPRDVPTFDAKATLL
jgi:hypothetical protein